jgi:hypothetical protein
MSNNLIINYLKNVFHPWYHVHVTQNIMPYNHPLYHFQIQTKYNYNIEQAIVLIFQISELREYALELLIITNIYMRRLITNITHTYTINYVYTTTNVTSIFFICILLASKYFMDEHIENKELYRISYYNQITIQTFNYLEIKLLELIDYDLYVTPEEYHLYERMINDR